MFKYCIKIFLKFNIMYDKIRISNNVFDFPMPITLLGTTLHGKINFMTLAWISRVTVSPPMIGIGVNKNHLSHKSIVENGAFSINYPGIDLLKEADFCGIHSAAKVDKSEIFTTFFGELENAPMILECPLTYECQLIQEVDLKTHSLFIGEIINAFPSEEYLEFGKPQIKKINPMLLTMPDNNYWAVGEKIGNAWSDGKNLINCVIWELIILIQQRK